LSFKDPTDVNGPNPFVTSFFKASKIEEVNEKHHEAGKRVHHMD
jgi:hypothetical protein